jgi:hypothetical protein
MSYRVDTFACTLLVCLYATEIFASEHSARLAEIQSAYNADVQKCKAAFPKSERRNVCLKDARAAKKTALEGEAIAEKGRKQLAAKNAELEKQARKEGTLPPLTPPVKQ